MLEPPQDVGVAVVPLKVTVLLPWVGPNPAPLIAIDVPTGAVLGDRPVITGMMRKDLALLFSPLTATTTLKLPEPRLLGTGTPEIFVAVHDAGVTVTPPKLTVLLPCELPKLVPLMVIVEPTGVGGPTVGEMLLMLGAV